MEDARSVRRERKLRKRRDRMPIHGKRLIIAYKAVLEREGK